MATLQENKPGQSLSIHLSSTNEVLNGSFYSFDPESESVIIQNSDGHLMWINGHSIKSIKQSSKNVEPTQKPLQLLLIGKIEHISKQILQQNESKHIKLSDKVRGIQKQLIKYLEEHHLSPTVDKKTNRIKIGSSLYIIPPYATDCCRSNNEIILSSTLKLLNEFYANTKAMSMDEKKHDSDSEDLLEID